MLITNSTKEDLNEILRLYEAARSFQKIKNAVVWPSFDLDLIETEIAENRQWKIVMDNQVACVWAITFDDHQIWEARSNDPSIYIHRIATNPVFRGNNFVGEIIKWAKKYAKANGKKFIRVDTSGENAGLIVYYQKQGFDYLGPVKLKNPEGLPAHYHNAMISLFQMPADQNS